MASQQATLPFGPVDVEDDDMEQQKHLSPKKRGPPSDDPMVTVSALERLFEKQTRGLRDSQKLELARATGQIQAEFRRQMSSV